MQSYKLLFKISFYNKPINNLIKTINNNIVLNKPLLITTINASFLVNAFKNKQFYNFLISNKLNLVDGVGVQLAAEYLNNLPKVNKFLKPFIYFYIGIKLGVDFLFFNKKLNYLKYRITGVFLTKKILRLCQNKGYSICIIHKKNSLVSYTELFNYLLANYTGLKFTIYLTTGNERSLKSVPTSDVYLCTLGEVTQENLLSKMYKSRSKGIYIGIGSTFDVLTHKISSIPKFFKVKGLEWLYRLVTRPKRVKKIFRSAILFPLMVYKYSLNSNKISN